MKRIAEVILAFCIGLVVLSRSVLQGMEFVVYENGKVVEHHIFSNFAI